jgi:hypothetical protein
LEIVGVEFVQRGKLWLIFDTIHSVLQGEENANLKNLFEVLREKDTD